LKKSAIVGIGIGIALVIIVITVFSTGTAPVDKSSNTGPPEVPKNTTVTGKNFTIDLSESVGVGDQP
jgi:hypothetical protein